MVSKFAAIGLAAACLAGCAMTPEQQQAMGDAMQRVGQNMQNQPAPQRRQWTPQPGNVPQQPQYNCQSDGQVGPQAQIICTQQPVQ